MTTDGFLTNASDKQLERAMKGILCKEFKLSRKRLTPAKPEIHETKHIVRQPLGWRTRGQATLKFGNNDPSSDENIVLAKGGINLRGTYEKLEQNDEIVRIFLTRNPKMVMNIQTGVGIKDQYVYGNDFVDRTLTRVLSMEFDFKRKPHFADEIELQFDDFGRVNVC